MDLTPDQNAIVEKLSTTRCGGLIGHAGVGKTVTASGLVGAIRASGRIPILTAPTHKAARVLQAKTGYEVTTIHALLGLVPLPNYEDGRRVLQMRGNPEFAPNTVIVIDEASMLTPRILDILESLRVSIILIGDAAQLPPVGSTNPVFTQWLQAKGSPAYELTEILRQAGDNPLPIVAEKWRPSSAAAPQWPRESILGREGGVAVMRRPDAVAGYLDNVKSHFLLGESSDTVRPWLAYTNAATQTLGDQARRAMYGDDAIHNPFMKHELMLVGNPVIHDSEIILNTSSPVRITEDAVHGTFEKLGETWDAWTCVIQPEGSTQSFQITAMPFSSRKSLLDMLAQRALDLMKSNARQVLVHRAWEDFHSMENDVVDLRTIYASTIHKSQGSTYTDVYLDKVDIQNPYASNIMRPLVYTAMTRASGTAIIAK